MTPTKTKKLNEYKKTYRDKINSRIFSGDLLRLMCYMLSGVFLVSFKWYIGFPLGVVFLFFGQFIEDSIDKLKKKIQ